MRKHLNILDNFLTTLNHCVCSQICKNLLLVTNHAGVWRASAALWWQNEREFVNIKGPHRPGAIWLSDAIFQFSKANLIAPDFIFSNILQLQDILIH